MADSPKYQSGDHHDEYGTDTQQTQLRPGKTPQTARVPAGRVEQVGGATRVTISTDGTDPSTREPEKAPRPQASNEKWRYDAYTGQVTVEYTDRGVNEGRPSYPENVAVTPAGAIVPNVSGLKPLDVVTINGRTDTVISHELRGNLARGEDGALRLRGTSSVVAQNGQQQQNQQQQQDTDTEASVPLPPNVARDLSNIGKALGAGQTLGMFDAIAAGSDVSVEINGLARSFGIEPSEMKARVDKVAWNLTQQGIVMANSNPDEWDAFYSWATKERPAQVRAARAQAAEWGRFGATTRLVEEFRTQSSAGFTEGELLALDGALVNGSPVRVYKDGSRIMFSSPQTGSMDMRTAIRSGIVKLSLPGAR